MDKDNSQKQPEEKGLLVVYTGNGKGKTTAALGMCLRAVGYDWRICLIQFVKGSWKYGELDGLKRLEPNLEMHVIGEGFVGIVDDDKDFSEHREAARKGVKLAIEKIESREFPLIILDELNVAVDLGLVTEEELEQILAARNDKQHLVITGRSATNTLIDKADLVTEMTEVKHPYQQGILAQRGIDW